MADDNQKKEQETMNPAMLFTLKKKIEEFQGRHPKFAMFIQDLMKSGVGEGSIIDVSVTLPNGQVLKSNMKVSAEDVELIKDLGSMNK